jgi:hypothetical protein
MHAFVVDSWQLPASTAGLGVVQTWLGGQSIAGSATGAVHVLTLEAWQTMKSAQSASLLQAAGTHA